jgi:ubiquinone/menaquinone biosynthesis C-methylase UbiE
MERSAFAAASDRVMWDFYASAYDDLARYYRPYAEVTDEAFLRASAAVKKGGAILDAGCGTGELSIKLLNSGYKLTAGDISNSMLNLFRKKLSKLPAVSGVCAVMELDLNKKLPFEKSTFDGVVSVHALFMLSDIPATLGEFDRVLKPGGRVVIAHVKPVSIRVLLEKEFEENGFSGMAKVFIRLFKVGVINLLVSGVHRRLYGITEAENIIRIMGARGYTLVLHRAMYRGYDDFMVFDKKRR